MCKALIESGINVIILTPFEDDKNVIHDVDMAVLPSTFSRLHLTTLMYKVARRLSSSSLTSRIFLSQSSVRQMANRISRSLRGVLEKKRFDIIHAVQQPTALGCAPLARKYNIPLVADIHNVWSEESVSQGYIESGDRIYAGLQNIEKEILCYSDAVTVPTQYMKDYMKSKFGEVDDKIVVVPHGGFLMDSSSFPLDRDSNVVYSGMVSHREHVDLFANSIQHVRSSASFFISNYGDQLPEVKKITSRPNCPRVNYVWFKDRQKILELLKRSKIGILTSANDIARQLGPPVKLLEYLSCGLPIVANDIGGWCKIINEFDVGIITEDEPRSLAEAIDTLLQDGELWNKMHKNSLDLVKNRYNWNTNANNILIPLYRRISNN
jgi:glycosyltransferase involved in cell wall biosynthesis